MKRSFPICIMSCAAMLSACIAGPPQQQQQPAPSPDASGVDMVEMPEADGGITATDANGAIDQGASSGAIARVKLSVTSDRVNAIAENFPVPLRLGPDEERQMAFDGATVWFTDMDGEVLPSELSSVGRGGNVSGWVEWPLVSPDADSSVWMMIGPGTNRPTIPTMWEAYSGVWHFDLGRSLFEDSSPNGNHGASDIENRISGVAVVGTGIALNGTTDYVSIADSPSLRNNDFTIMAWLRRTEGSGPSTIVSKSYNQSGFWSYGLKVSNSDSLFAVATPDDTDVYSTFESNAQVPSSTWSHVAFTRSEGQIKLMIDGQVVHDPPFVQPLGFDAGELLIGAEDSPDGLRGFFAGSIDELMILPIGQDREWVELNIRAQSSEDFVRVGRVETLMSP